MSYSAMQLIRACHALQQLDLVGTGLTDATRNNVSSRNTPDTAAMGTCELPLAKHIERLAALVVTRVYVASVVRCVLWPEPLSLAYR